MFLMHFISLCYSEMTLADSGTGIAWRSPPPAAIALDMTHFSKVPKLNDAVAL